MLGREVVEGQQHVVILLQALCRLRVFGLVESNKIIEVTLGLTLFRSHPNLMQFVFRLCLQALWKFIEHVSRLVNPATLPTGVGIYLAECFPKPKPAVSYSQLRTLIKTTSLKVQQQLGPG